MQVIMNSAHQPVKDDEAPHPVPHQWRAALTGIVAALVAGRTSPTVQGEDVQCTRNAWAQIGRYLVAYGESLVELPEATWTTSVASWMGGFWDVFVDLWAVSGRSERVLAVSVHEVDGGRCRFTVEAVYVP
ncbi:MAG: hypothetical protein IPL61_20190 [Myxococcales bacterium]|nr:hypothetical protein [Myxococcales bacterium]